MDRRFLLIKGLLESSVPGDPVKTVSILFLLQSTISNRHAIERKSRETYRDLVATLKDTCKADVTLPVLVLPTGVSPTPDTVLSYHTADAATSSLKVAIIYIPNDSCDSALNYPSIAYEKIVSTVATDATLSSLSTATSSPASSATTKKATKKRANKGK